MPLNDAHQSNSYSNDLSKKIKDAYDNERKRIPKKQTIFHQSSFYFTYHICMELLKEKMILGEKILDIGCNEGLFGEILKREKIRMDYIGLDITDESLKAGKRWNPNFHFLNASATSLPFQNDTFMYIVSSETLEHIPDHISALKEIFRIMKPHGRLILSVPNYGNPILAAIARFYKIFLGNPHFAMGEQIFEHHFTMEYLDDLFQKLSFRIIRSIGAHYVPNKDSLIFLTEVFPFFRMIMKKDYFYSNTRFKTQNIIKKYGTNIFYLLEKP
ncbi:MAG: class I SAM-dependent methyltransferase [Candidatus Hodarchaeales archaeon]|jgi:ubiquinone/menaquinone biosynthesis C-methylase UbiE